MFLCSSMALGSLAAFFAVGKILMILGGSGDGVGGWEVFALIVEVGIVVVLLAGRRALAGVLGVCLFGGAGLVAVFTDQSCSCAGTLVDLSRQARVWLGSLGGCLGAAVWFLAQARPDRFLTDSSSRSHDRTGAA